MTLLVILCYLGAGDGARLSTIADEYKLRSFWEAKSNEQ